MISLNIIGEGKTELNFARNVLKPHLNGFKVFVDARSVLTSRDRRNAVEHRGGLQSYNKAKKDIQTWLIEQPRDHFRFTTMFDLYRLPDNFPGYAEAAQKKDPYERIRILEERVAQDINDRRFIPYIQLHEFESLVLAAPQNLDSVYLGRDAEINALIAMVGDQNPELINDHVETAPSKRILKQIPEYRKATAGVAVTEKTGLPTLRARCRHFNEWLSRLEQLSGAAQ